MDSLALELPHASEDYQHIAAKSDKLRILVIPFKSGMAVLSNNLVVEVLPFAPPLGLENAPPWVIGSMLWKAMPLPLVSLEYLTSGESQPSHGLHNRIIVVQAINDLPKLRYYAFVGSAAPRIVDIERGDVTNDAFVDRQSDLPFAPVLLQGERAIIPQVDDIEAILSHVISAARFV